MNRNSLQQLFYLDSKIKGIQRKLEELTEAATRANKLISGIPSKAKANDRMADYAVEIVDTKMKLAEDMKKCFIERDRLMNEIKNIKQSDIKRILYLRYLKGLTWKQIAFFTGYHDESVPRKKLDRYLNKYVGS